MDQVTKLLLETSRQLFADGCEPELQASAEAGHFPTELWQQIEDNGLTQALVPESAGGVDVGLESACAVLRVAGAFALPLPLADTMLGAMILADAGIDVPNGTLAVAASELLYSDGQLTGTASGIPWLPAADHVVLVARDQSSNATKIACLRPAELGDSILPTTDASGEPLGDLDLSRANDLNAAAIDSSLSQDWVEHTAALMRVSLIAGTLDRILDLCIEHTTERVQFGLPVAKFQAVQNLVAVIAGEVAAIGVSAPAAVRSWAENDDRFAVACAKTRAGTASSKTAKLAHQVHAAIGYTQEHILHRFTRRLWSWRDHYGDENSWAVEAGRTALAEGGDGLWPKLTVNG